MFILTSLGQASSTLLLLLTILGTSLLTWALFRRCRGVLRHLTLSEGMFFL